MDDEGIKSIREDTGTMKERQNLIGYRWYVIKDSEVRIKQSVSSLTVLSYACDEYNDTTTTFCLQCLGS